MLNPILAAWTLVLAQACAYTGSVLLGWHAGIFVDQLRLWNLRSDQTITWLAVAMAGGGLVMIVVGLMVERFCRIPPEDGDAESAPGCPANAQAQGGRRVCIPRRLIRRGSHGCAFRPNTSRSAWSGGRSAT